jgi:pimeloyl-ACP methyl ester carboxylesterase
MSDPTLAKRLGDIDIPVHVLWGESDGIAGPDYGRAFAAAIPLSKFTLLPRTGHLPQVETPEELLGALLDL